MNYYPFHIGDFRSGTINMSRQARWIYRDMLDVYYDAEKPLPLDLDVLCEEIGVESAEERRIVERHLRFKFVKTDDGYRHEICEKVIADYHKKAATAQTNGKLGGRPKKAIATEQKPTGLSVGSNPDPTGHQEETQSQTNQEPITNNQKQDRTLSDPAGSDAVGDEIEPDTVEKRKKRRGTEEDAKAARWMFGLVLTVNATAKQPNWEVWADEVRLMREIDGRTHKEICELFQWAKHDSFWCSNIQSPSKLREKWDQLTERRAQPARSGGRPSINAFGTADDGDDDPFKQLRRA